MALRKCCVGMCDSTNQTHRLFNLPKNDELRDLWLSFLIPTNVELSALSKEQLITKRVCHKHFDRYQFDSTGNRIQNGYPSLFTPKEISYGVALSSSVGDHLSDHNYFLQIVPEESIEALATIVVEGDHAYGKPLEFQVPNTSEIVPENIIPAMEAKLTDGTIEVSGQCLSVVYDPPHLLKGIRNNFLTKKIIYKGKIATWEDILTVYNTDCQLGHTRMNKKLTEHHVIAEKIKKMKVNVAAQVLSQQTSAMLKYTSLFKTTVTGQSMYLLTSVLALAHISFQTFSAKC